MTLIFERAVDGPATHAFVIGVGGYPDCKPGKGVTPALRNFKDIPSAADSARFMCDWLLANQGPASPAANPLAAGLAAPLASLEVLIAEAPHPNGQAPFPWTNPGPAINRPTLANVEQAGAAWLARTIVRPGDVAFFYACGHGANLGSDPVLLLTDLNTGAQPWNSYLNLMGLARAFKQLEGLKAAFFFADACQDRSLAFEAAPKRGGALILDYDVFLADRTREKVAFLSASSDAQKTHEGLWSKDPKVRLGRFTQTLRLALDGASTRRRSGDWVVYPSPLFEDLKLLYRLRPDWQDKPFEPSQPISQNDFHPIIRPSDPYVPVLIMTDPAQAMADHDLRIFANPDRAQPSVAERDGRAPTEWLAWVRASTLPHFAVAEGAAAWHQEAFIPTSPIFDHRIHIS